MPSNKNSRPVTEAADLWRIADPEETGPAMEGAQNRMPTSK